MTAAPARPDNKISRVRWLIIFLAFLGTALNIVDRANLGVAIPYMEKEFHLGPTATGTILGGFFWTYAILQLPSGWFVDRVGARIAYTAAVVWWSAFTALTAAARSFASLMGMRVLLGIGEAPAYPTNTKVVSEWFPRRERAFATSIYDSGGVVGSALALPIVGAIIGAFGWRASFVMTGALGLVWAFVWFRFYRAPGEHRWVSPAELALIEDESRGHAVSAPTGPPVRWRDLFRYRNVWGMMLGFFCLNFVASFFVTWFPSYLVKAHGFDLLKLSTFGAIPALVAVPGGYLGGLCSDALLRRGFSLTWARKIPIAAGLIASSSIGLTAFVPSAAWALALLALCNAGLRFAAASMWSLPADMAPTKHHVASISGIQNFASNLGGICISQFVGIMLARTGGFVAPLLVAGALALLGACSYLFMVGDVAPLRARD